MKNEIKLNIGCAGRLLKNYINIDQDSIETIKKRYPDQKIDDNLEIKQYDIFNLPYENNSVDEVRADGLIEHLTFKEEKIFFYEILRILKKGGKIQLSTVDFDKTIQQWVLAEDDWIDFHRDDDEAIKKNFWFGTYTYEPKNKWGYLTASLFGSQNGEGQFHKNCYTEKKLNSMCKKLNLKVIKIEKFRWKEDRDHMLNLIAEKI